MHLITKNVNTAFNYFCEHWYEIPNIRRESRNGPVIKFTGITTVTYEHPTERVLLNPARDANPFFHLYESLWMLNGQNDVASLSYFTSKMAQYSDNGKTFHGAYGYRWRKYFGYDQLDWIIEELKTNPDSRRCVLAMWDGGRTNEDWSNQDTSKPNWKDPEAIEGTGDLYIATHGGKDVPCNLSCVFEVEEGKLNMTVFNRSNDLVKGMFGANVVHFSFLQDYVAGFIGIEVGKYNQVSSNLHIYTDLWKPEVWSSSQEYYYHAEKQIPLVEIGTDYNLFQSQLSRICKEPTRTDSIYMNRFLREICVPMFVAFERYKAKDFDNAVRSVEYVQDEYWKEVGLCWILKRKANHESRSNKV